MITSVAPLFRLKASRSLRVETGMSPISNSFSDDRDSVYVDDEFVDSSSSPFAISFEAQAFLVRYQGDLYHVDIKPHGAGLA